MKQLALFTIIAITLMACNKSRPSYLMPRETKVFHDCKLPASYKGPFGTSIGENTVKEFTKILESSEIIEEKREKEFIYEIPDSIFSIEHISSIYVKENKIFTRHDYICLKGDIYITAIAYNDTVVHMSLNAKEINKKLIEKYGDGEGELTESTFGTDKNGEPDFKDFWPGNEYRHWENKFVNIEYTDNYIGEKSYPLRAEINKQLITPDTKKVEIISIKHYKLIKTLIDNHIATEREKIKQSDIIKDL